MIDALEIAGLAVSRGGRGLFAGLDFRLGRGEAAALTGPNGAGKTSLLRAVAGLLRPDAGTIAFAGAPSADEARSRALHMIGHQDGLKAQRTAWEELRFQTLWCGGTEATARAAATSLELERLLDLDVRRLSAGQRRRLALARLVAAPRDLWLLDEPMAPLDAKFRDRFAAMLAAHLDGGGLALVAVHDRLPGATRSLEIGG